MKLIVVSPHMDDETIGAGGTMLKYAQAGEQVIWLNVSNAKTEYGYSEDFVHQRESQRLRVAELLHVADAIDLKLRPAALSTYPDADVIETIGQIIRKVEPEMIIAPAPADIHSDHATVYRWVKAFSKSFRLPSLKRFATMEIISETEFSLDQTRHAPNFFVDITNQMTEKLSALQVYSGELGNHPFPRNLKNI